MEARSECQHTSLWKNGGCGDFIGVRGEIFKTHKGELRYSCQNLCFWQSNQTIAGKFHGIQDQEAIYRKRYLDLVMNPDSYKRFQFKSEFYKVLRDFYVQE